MLCRVWGRGRITENFNGSVVACRRKELVGRVERDALDMALMRRDGLELLERVARPNNDLGVEPDGHQQGRVRGPGQVLNIVFVAYQSLVRLPIFCGRRVVVPKGDGRRSLVQVVYANELVVGTAGQVPSIGGKPHRVNCPQVMAHVAELARLRVAGIFRIEDGVGRPDSNVAITTGGRESFAIGGNVTAIHLKVFLLTTVTQPRGLYDVHVGGARGMGSGND